MCSAPCEVERWLREKQRTLDHHHLQDLFHATVHALQEEIPGLGEVVAIDVKHQYAWVRENNFRESIKDRFCKERQPRGDPDCRVGVKSSTNQEQPDGSKKERKEYLWGYGSGIAAATTPDYGDVVLAEFTQPFNESDVSYYLPLYIQTVAVLGFFPLHLTADAAYDAWYVYQTCAHREGIMAIPLNRHGHEEVPRDRDGVPLCPIGLRMHPTYRFLPCCFLNGRERPASTNNSRKAKAVSKTSISRRAASCEPCSIAPPRSTARSIGNAPVLNASTVKPKPAASNGPKCVKATR